MVYHIPPDQIDKGIYFDQLSENSPNTMWLIQGTHDPKEPITYGTIPANMREAVQAKPLVEGEYYFVYVASLVGRRFVVRNGKAEEM
jgi:hypothetical protein